MSEQQARPRPSLYGATAIIAGSTFLSRILGLVREQVFAYFFGAGLAADAFQIAFRIPNLLRDLFAEGAMSAALIPTYARLRQEKGEAAAWRLVSNVITTLALVTCVIALVGAFFSGPLVALYAGGFQAVPGKFELTVELTRLLWPFLPFVVMAAVWMGVLNSREVYGMPALASSFFNLTSILAAFTLCPLFAHYLGIPAIYGWALGATLGGLAQWAVQVPSLRREGFRYQPVLEPRDPALGRMVAMMGAGTFALATTQVNLFVSSSLAAGLGTGAVSWLSYAFRLMQLPIGIFGVAISTANFTRVSREAAAGNLQAVRDSLRDSLRMAMVLTIPSSFGLAVLGVPIISVIYERGRFTAEDTYQTSLALAAYALGLFAYSTIRIMVPVLYAVGRSRSAVWSSGLGMLLNVALCFALVGPLGFKGLALAMSASALLNAAVLLHLIQRHLKQIEFKNLGECLVKTLVASLFMTIIVYVFLGFIEATPFRPIPLTGVWDKANLASRLLFLLLALGSGITAYGIAAKLLRLREWERLSELIWKRLRTRSRGNP